MNEVMSWSQSHFLLRFVCTTALVASVGCGDDAGTGGGGGTGASGGNGGLLDPHRQGYANLCVRICQSAGRCIVEDSGSGRAAIQRCAVDCEETTRALDPSDISQECLDASSDTVFCYENASCESIYDGSACREENDRAFATCPSLSGTECGFDCSGCPSDTIITVCQASAGTCRTPTCCGELDSLFAECTGATGECSFDCSLCSGDPRAMCEAFQGVCDTLTGAERTTCCNDVTSIYSIMCSS
jgi:hypothetical protein